MLPDIPVCFALIYSIYLAFFAGFYYLPFMYRFLIQRPYFVEKFSYSDIPLLVVHNPCYFVPTIFVPFPGVTCCISGIEKFLSELSL